MKFPFLFHPHTQIAFYEKKRKAKIKCLFLIVSLCFLLHFLLSQIFCCCLLSLRFLSLSSFSYELPLLVLMDMLFLMCLKQTQILIFFIFFCQHVKSPSMYSEAEEIIKGLEKKKKSFDSDIFFKVQVGFQSI